MNGAFELNVSICVVTPLVSRTIFNFPDIHKYNTTVYHWRGCEMYRHLPGAYAVDIRCLQQCIVALSLPLVKPNVEWRCDRTVRHFRKVFAHQSLILQFCFSTTMRLRRSRVRHVTSLPLESPR